MGAVPLQLAERVRAAGAPVRLAELTSVSPAYAPPGATLVSASVIDPAAAGLDDEALLAAARRQLAGWFGAGVHGWRHLRTYRIAHALPPLDPPTLEQPERPVRVRP